MQYIHSLYPFSDFLILYFPGLLPYIICLNIYYYTNKIMSKLISNHKSPVTSFAQLFKNRLSSQSDEQPHQNVSSSFSPQIPIQKQYNDMPSNFYAFSCNQKCVYCQQKFGELQCQQCNKKRYCRKCFDDTHEGVKFSLHQTRQLKALKNSNEPQMRKKVSIDKKDYKIGDKLLLKNSKNNGNCIFEKEIKKQQNNVEENNLKKKVQIYLINLEEKIHKINNRWDIVEQIFKKQLSDLKQVISDIEKNMTYEINNKRRQQLNSLEKVFGQNSLRDLKNQILFTQSNTPSFANSDNSLNKMKQFCGVYDRWAKNTRKCCQLISSTIQEQFQQAKSFLIKIDIKSMLSKPGQKNESYILQDHNQNLSSKDKSKSRAIEKTKISFFNIRNNRNSSKYDFNNGMTNSFMNISPSEINKLQVKKVKSQTTLPGQLLDYHLIKVNKRNKVGQGLTNRPK